jgi:hypothetical protein
LRTLRPGLVQRSAASVDLHDDDGVPITRKPPPNFA